MDRQMDCTHLLDGLTCQCGDDVHSQRAQEIHDWLRGCLQREAVDPEAGDVRLYPWHERWPFSRDAQRLEFALQLAAQPTLVRYIALCPLTITSAITEHLREGLQAMGSASQRDAVRWALTTALVDVAWQALLQESGNTTSREDLIPALARARFLLLAAPQALTNREPFMTKFKRQDRCDDLDDAMFDTPEDYSALLRDARAVWASILNQHQSYPTLAMSEEDLERAVDRLVTIGDGRALLRTGARSDGAHQLHRADTTHLVQVVEQHYLPTFRVRDVWRLDQAAGLWRLLRRAPVVFLAVGMGLPFLALWGPSGVCWVRWASVVSVVLGLIGAGVDSLQPRPLGAMKWLWRLPAAAVVGFLLLVALSRTWWQGLHGHGFQAVMAAVLLFAASLGYLLLEAHNHGVRRGLWSRTFIVFSFTAAHSYVVATVGLNVLAGVFMDGAVAVGPQDTTTLAAQLDNPATYLALVWLSTAWCASAGVFSQILWDDRPVTAPLAHMQWKKGG